LTTFYLVRHGEPNWALKDERNLIGAMRDYVPLTEKGAQQAEQLIDIYPHLAECDLILSSPYTRSLQTAAIMNRRMGLPLQVEFDLHEWTPDNWQASGIEEIIELMRDYKKHSGIYPAGEIKVWESKESLVDRLENVLNKYLDKSKVLVVCHGMVMAALLEQDVEDIDFCTVYEHEVVANK
jgi:broad specificity phosphatase PhoE